MLEPLSPWKLCFALKHRSFCLLLIWNQWSSTRAKSSYVWGHLPSALLIYCPYSSHLYMEISLMFHAEGDGKLLNRSLIGSRHWEWFEGLVNLAIIAGNGFFCSDRTAFTCKLIVWVHVSRWLFCTSLFCTSLSEFAPHKLAPNSLKAQRKSQSKLSNLGCIFIKAVLIHRMQLLTIL